METKKKVEERLEDMMKILEKKEEEMDVLVTIVYTKESYLKQQLDEDVKQIEEDKSCLNKLYVDKQEEMVGDDQLTKEKFKTHTFDKDICYSSLYLCFEEETERAGQRSGKDGYNIEKQSGQY